MFDNLNRGLDKAWDMVRKDGKLTPDNIKGPMREIRRALLEADVSLHPPSLLLPRSPLCSSRAFMTRRRPRTSPEHHT